MKLVLLPGLDGTGRLFQPLLPALPPWLQPLVISYPTDSFLDYSALCDYVRGRLPTSEPFALLGESFSGPIAVMIAANPPSNLSALILCATFVTNPTIVPPFLGRILFNSLLFRIHPPSFIIRRFAVGPQAPSGLVELVQSVLRTVRPEVLAKRVRATLGLDGRAELKRCSVPMLYLKPEDDKIVRSGCLDEMREARSDIKVVMLGGPHLILQREPEVASSIITSFIEGMSDTMIVVPSA
jgi:pimeloyl-[acyl-carrier protein] methyl ester esterase